MPLVHEIPDENFALDQLTSEACEGCFAKLLRALTARVRCRDTARDIAQEAFSRLLISASETTIRNPLGYLFHVAGQLAVDHRRAGDRALRQELEASAWESLPAPTVALDDMVDSRRCLNQLEEAVATLPPRCRRVFVLCKVEGHSHEEVAALLKDLAQRRGEARDARRVPLARAARRHGRESRRTRAGPVLTPMTTVKSEAAGAGQAEPELQR